MPPGLVADAGNRLVVGKRAGKLPVHVNILLQVKEYLLGSAKHIGPGQKATGRLGSVRNGEQGLGELGRVAGLLAVMAFVERLLAGATLVVVGEVVLGEVGRPLP